MESLVSNDNYLKSVQFGDRPGASEDSQEQLCYMYLTEGGRKRNMDNRNPCE